LECEKTTLSGVDENTAARQKQEKTKRKFLFLDWEVISGEAVLAK
jgi:hypothetical protein